MKRNQLSLPLLALTALLAIVGCGRKPAGSAEGLVQGFAEADAVVQADIAKAAGALAAGHHLEAVTTLDRVLQVHRLSDAEKEAVRAAFGEITRALATNPDLDTAECYRARGELMRKIYGEP